VGDTLRFDILGRPIEARITSVRSVDWADARAGGFMFVFRPGALDAAPQTFIAPVRGPSVAADRARVQRDLTAQYPNVSVVDVKEMLASAASVIRQVSLGVAVVGSLVLFSGMLILAGSVSMTTFQRVYEAAILKSVGATSGLIAAILCLEYSMLGVLSGVIGSSGAMGLSWAVSHFVLELPWRPQPGLALTGVAASGILVSMVGVGASLDVLRRKPLSTLRAE
jgi:putative ABC transport system permease protein